jgi:molybdate transport system ATP-binding protein
VSSGEPAPEAPVSAGLDAVIQLHRAEFALDVDLVLAPGEVLALLGPNGSGKSTLLGVLSGLLRPDGGHVRLGDRVLTDVAADVRVPPHERGVGMLAQQALLFPHLTALGNVAFGPRAKGASRTEAESIARRLLAEVDAGEFEGRKPNQLSGGQAQRVALARALAPKPGLLLLDEPLAALDVDAAPALRSLLRRVVRGGDTTTVLVTHDALDAFVLADRVMVLSEGKVAESGPTRDVLTRPRSAFTARIAGLDLVPGWARDGQVRTSDGLVFTGISAAPLTDGDEVVAVFPPSAVAVFRDEPNGSPRNVFEVELAALEPRGDIVRVRSASPPGSPDWMEGLAADVTPAAVADLGIEPGDRVWFAVKAAEVAIHQLAS